MHILYIVGWYSASLTLLAMEPWDFTLKKKVQNKLNLTFLCDSKVRFSFNHGELYN